jgi:DNA phosphorothioation-dependent restriction protein DptH
MKGIQEITPEYLAHELERVLYPQLLELLKTRLPGHCMRVSDLDSSLMIRLTQALRYEMPSAQVFTLTNGSIYDSPSEYLVTSTKLIELRNPLPDNMLRPPLLVFVPHHLKATAEDSFGVATFEELTFTNIYQDLKELLLQDFPNGFMSQMNNVLRHLHEIKWSFADAVSTVRYLLSVKLNAYDREVAGAALFELGLIPDFDLFKDPTRTLRQLERNTEKVRLLTWSNKSERGRVLDLGIRDQALRQQFTDFLVEAGLENPRHWTRRIALESDLWAVAFHRWRFNDDDLEVSKVRISVTELHLKQVNVTSEPRLQQFFGSYYLPVGKQGSKSLTIVFRTDPHPSKVTGLDHFLLDVVTQEGTSIGLTQKISVKPRKEGTISATLKKIDRADWEEGWYFARIQGLTKDGDPIPLLELDFTNQARDIESKDQLPPSNYSEPFYALADVQTDEYIEPRAVPKEDSLMHAWRRLQLSALQQQRPIENIQPTEKRWQSDKNQRSNKTTMLEVQFGRHGIAEIPIPTILKNIEQEILRFPFEIQQWQIRIESGQAQTSKELKSDSFSSTKTEFDEFFATRKKYFEAVYTDNYNLITQASDFTKLEPTAIAYVEAYLRLLVDQLQESETTLELKQSIGQGLLQQLLSLDTVQIELGDQQGSSRHALLLSPLHPMRIMWFMLWNRTGDLWLRQVAGTNFIGAVRDGLLNALTPHNCPPTLPQINKQLYAAIDHPNLFWSIYASIDEQDPRGLATEVCQAIGLPERSIGGTTLDGKYLGNKVQRFLAQHPYVQNLMINVFNPGSGTVLVDMLLELQKNPIYKDLSYSMRLFVQDPDSTEPGQAFQDLISPNENVTTQEVDAFATVSQNHLFPKFSFALQSIQSFRVAPEIYDAHLSFLFDMFPAKNMRAEKAWEEDKQLPVFGLRTTFHEHYVETSEVVAWHRQPVHGFSGELENGEVLTDLFPQLAKHFDFACAVVATGQSGIKNLPTITLTLDDHSRTLVHQVHDISDWVVTIDRNMGIEFYDHGGRPGRPDYLIDHSPNSVSAAGHRLVITSRSLRELETILQPGLEELKLPSDPLVMNMIISQIRALSGQLALKLYSSPTQYQEVLGLAFARLFLNYQDALKNQIIIPLDAHLDLYTSINKQGDIGSEDIRFKRTDLALFDLDFEYNPPRITCRLVEVKCYKDLSQYVKLKSQVIEQLDQTQNVLSYHFATDKQPDRPDRLLKTHDFIVLLRFYLNRAIRYQVFEPVLAKELMQKLDDLQNGYHLKFTRAALLFDLEGQGIEFDNLDKGVEFYRIGKNAISELIQAQMDQESIKHEDSFAEDIEIHSQNSSLSKVNFLVPKFESSAFMSLKNIRIPPIQAIDSNHSDKNLQPQDTELSLNTKDETLNPPILSIDSKIINLEVPQISLKPISYDVVLGVNNISLQYGVLGEVAGRKVALDLNETHTISLFGVQGGGKSYTLGTIAEMASMPIPNLNNLQKPLATVIFHYSPTQDYKPEFTSMVDPNQDESQIKTLYERFQARPQGLSNVILLVPQEKLKDRLQEYPKLKVYPLKFAATELQANHWRFLMGAVGNQSVYIRQLNRIMRQQRDNLTLDAIRHGVDQSDLSDAIKKLAHQRLDLASEFIDDTVCLSELVQPGRLIIVDLRDEFLEKDQALGLFVVLLQIFAEAKDIDNELFNKLVIFDEAHKYIDSPDLVAGLIEVVREMRHKATSIMVASQDPPSVPVALIELSTHIIMHKFNSPAWLKHIQKANSALGSLTSEKMNHLGAGEAYVWASKATDDAFTSGTMKIRCRPRVTRHGGDTKTALK